mmetsp:Transcript_93821/g.265374  ORF Transcript_93821/g.265374 Transcript_93821/m.265374 type:complete len:254 (-) Transcript_93821:419-1180(-)
MRGRCLRPGTMSALLRCIRAASTAASRRPSPWRMPTAAAAAGERPTRRRSTTLRGPWVWSWPFPSPASHPSSSRAERSSTTPGAGACQRPRSSGTCGSRSCTCPAARSARLRLWESSAVTAWRASASGARHRRVSHWASQGTVTSTWEATCRATTATCPRSCSPWRGQLEATRRSARAGRTSTWPCSASSPRRRALPGGSRRAAGPCWAAASHRWRAGARSCIGTCPRCCRAWPPASLAGAPSSSALMARSCS